MLKNASVSKKCVSLHRDLEDNKSRQNAYWISSFSRKSPVFDLTEGQMPMLFAYMCCNGTSIGIRHSGKVPSLLKVSGDTSAKTNYKPRTCAFIVY